MATKLDKLLENIDPEKTITETYNRANHALNTFNYSAAQIEAWNDFKCCMENFLRHVDSCVLRLRKPLDVASDYYWPHCVRVLLDIYGINGEKAAFEMARTGNDGGLYAVLKAMAMRVTEDYSKNEIKARVNQYWNDLPVDEKLEAADEYIEKYGHLLPSELTEGGAARIRANFPKFLEKHPAMIQKLRGVGR